MNYRKINEKLSNHLDYLESEGIIGERLVLEDVNLEHLTFYGQDFGDSTLWGVSFFECDLRDCNFVGADITNCDFTGCRLTGATFTADQLASNPTLTEEA